MTLFPGFELTRIDCGEATLRVRFGGDDPPLLLLHGHPQTHVMWHRVAPLLADTFTVVCPDLRGYGESSKPVTTEDHEPYSKRATRSPPSCVHSSPASRVRLPRGNPSEEARRRGTPRAHG